MPVVSMNRRVMAPGLQANTLTVLAARVPSRGEGWLLGDLTQGSTASNEITGSGRVGEGEWGVTLRDE
jgi:hypothetical protein